MSTRTSSGTPERSHAIWSTAPVPTARRPWLLFALALLGVALIIAGSLGPWLYTEDGPSRALRVETLPGTANDGVFSLVFALVAGVLLLLVLARPASWPAAWGAVAVLALCSLVGVFDWLIFDPMALTPPSSGNPEVIRVEWGLKLVTIASPLTMLVTILLARHLMEGDY